MQATYYGGHIGDGQALSGVKFLATMISMDEVFSDKTGVSTCLIRAALLVEAVTIYFLKRTLT